MAAEQDGGEGVLLFVELESKSRSFLCLHSSAGSARAKEYVGWHDPDHREGRGANGLDSTPFPMVRGVPPGSFIEARAKYLCRVKHSAYHAER